MNKAVSQQIQTFGKQFQGHSASVQISLDLEVPLVGIIVLKVLFIETVVCAAGRGASVAQWQHAGLQVNRSSD